MKNKLEILCRLCGHSIERHNLFGGCHVPYETIDDEINIPKDCLCNFTPNIVEAFFWWDFYKKEVYRLREKFINEDACPDCEGYLKAETIGLPDNTTEFVYRCCSCDKVWSYYGKDLTNGEKDE